MKLFHGSDRLKKTLVAGTYVTKRLRDAQKFGYRRSVLSCSPKVYIHTLFGVKEEALKRDETRDGAYVLLEEIPTNLVQIINTYDTPAKLSNFHKDKQGVMSA